MWYKLYIRVSTKGLRVSSGNFATLYYNNMTYDWIIDDHENGDLYTLEDIRDLQSETICYETACWCDVIIRDVARLVMQHPGYNLSDYDSNRIKYLTEV